MAESGKTDGLKLGFLTAMPVSDRGFVGGLLVTNHLGRPLEFQCTAPVRPNRTQEILYGPTLAPFLLADVIGKTLLEKANVKPDLVLVEDIQLLELRNQTSLPIACLSAASADTPDPRRSLKLGGQVVTFSETHVDDCAQIAKRASLVPAEADLNEPFERVRNALQETLGTSSAAAA